MTYSVDVHITKCFDSIIFLGKFDTFNEDGGGREGGKIALLSIRFSCNIQFCIYLFPITSKSIYIYKSTISNYI